MMNTPEFRTACVQALEGAAARVPGLSAFVGLDGFVDQIIAVVDERRDARNYARIPTIASLAERIAAASGRSTNVELVTTRTKLGGNGPIMANALAAFGVKVTYLGALGYPSLDPVFEEFAKNAEVHSIADPGRTDALEFEDGKLLFGKMFPLAEVTWENIEKSGKRALVERHMAEASLVGFVNWTMLPYMSDIWEVMQSEVCPKLNGPRRWMFFDLADPEKRPIAERQRALNLIASFQKHFDCILGLNEKEAFEVGEVLGFGNYDHGRAGLQALTAAIHKHVPVDTIVVHPTRHALACSGGTVDDVDGPFVAKPLITTGAGDHFNSGFVLGKLLGLTNAQALLCGVSTSGFYVRTGQSPRVSDIVGLMRDWPSQ
jgi:sugar/nucleoside kinase (ribokinase family)